jgi:hypothetical protein
MTEETKQDIETGNYAECMRCEQPILTGHDMCVRCNPKEYDDSIDGANFDDNDGLADNGRYF